MTGSDAVLTRLMALHPKLIDLSLGRTIDLLNRLGRPQDRLPPVVHVAGTNGKGSTLAFLRAMAEAAGLKVHVYTSPHLARFHERIRLAGSLIEEPALLELLEQCEAVNEGREITFFEITTCAAFKAFADVPADLVLLETGLGGRLDSTNVVAQPTATGITPISLDHTQFLGDTVEKIAAEKAAIQKSGVPSVIAPQRPEVLKVVSDYANDVGAPIARAGYEWQIGPDANGLRFDSSAWSGHLPMPGLPGAHQIENVGTAIALACVLRDQGFDLPDSALSSGVAEASWPARLQTLKTGPIIDRLPAGWTVMLDGGHNPSAGLALADALSKRSEGSIHVIAGMLNNKAADDFLAPLVPQIASLQTVTIPDEPNSFTAQELAEIAQAVGVESVATARSVDDAIGTLSTQPPGLLVICGSLYLAGHILKTHG